MITGIVTNREARVGLTLQGAASRELIVEAIIGTGFTGDLTLPSVLIERLQLRWLFQQIVTLADGSTRSLDVYSATVNWDGHARAIEVNAADTDPLVGMRLLSGFELRMQVRPGGSVTIAALS